MSGTVILNIVIVLGIIIAGGFLIFFMGDLFMSIINPKKDEKAIKAKEEKETEEVKEEIESLSPEAAEEVKSNPEVASLIYGGDAEAYNPEEEDADESEESEEDEVSEEVEETEDDEEEDDEDARNAYIEERRRELMERLASINQQNDEDEEEVEEESEEEEEEETVDVDEVNEEESEEQDSDKQVEDAMKALEDERAKNEALLAELNAARAEIAKQNNPKEEILLSEEDYLARLAVEEERLKINEDELRACKKEYLPLRKIKRTLDNDVKKLRRKEILVAKQQVVLYGVNNYADIDEAKAKKLTEDLDHLDGLKLSVENCQEVMNKNAERYPLLEKMYEILTSQNEQIKSNIESIKAGLEKVRANKD